MAGTEVPLTLAEQLLLSNLTVDLQCLRVERMSVDCGRASLWEKTSPVTAREALIALWRPPCVCFVRQFRSKGRRSATRRGLDECGQSELGSWS